jgi:small GTP-binding protein
MKRITIGIVAHVDAGKTTLSEAMLYRAGEIRNYGSVDNGDTVMDSDPAERARGITIYSSIAEFKHKESEITILDTPGHTDFSGETERTLGVLDSAILIISGTDGVQSHTNTLYKLLKKKNIPTYIFVNKMDIAMNSREDIKADIKVKLRTQPMDMTDENDEKWLEDAASESEKLMDKYLETGSLDTEDVVGVIQTGKAVPVIFGSARQQEGVERLIDIVDRYTPALPEKKDFGGKIFKVLRDEKGERLTFVKVTGGTLKVRQAIEDGDKINGIRKYTGGRYKTVPELTTGEIGAVEGLQKTFPGQGIGSEKNMEAPSLRPVISYRILPENKVSTHTLLEALKKIEEEDPLLEVTYILKKDEIRVSLMGPVQKEVLYGNIKSKYNISVKLDSGEISYKETIGEEVAGHGHFEPLRHFADVRLRFIPSDRGAGVIVRSEISRDELEENYQNQIIRYLQRGITGILTGSPLTDVEIVIIGGASHKKHTSGGDFNKAVEIAVRNAEMNTENVILEPVYHIIIEVPVNRIGRALNDMEKMYGKVETSVSTTETAVIEGMVPVSELGDYAMILNSYTGGIGKMSVEPAGYIEAHDQDLAIENADYDYRTDIDHPFESIYVHGEADTLVPIKNKSAKTRKTEAETETGGYTGIGGLEPELKAIFERTYGEIKSSSDTNKRIQEYKEGIDKDNVEEDHIPDKYEIRNLEKLRKKAEKNKKSYMIVDGYNVIFNWKELKELSEINLDSARGKLIDILSNYQGYTGCHMLVVFDAYRVKGQAAKRDRYQNVKIAYTAENQTADSYIEREVYNIMSDEARNVTVVTSDGWVQRIVSGEGALRMSSSEFYNVCNEVR